MLKPIIALLLVVCTSSLFAQVGGRKALPFLSLANSAHQEALGSYLVPFQTKDVSMTYYNPAELDPSMHRFLSINTVLYPGGVTHGVLSYAKKRDSISAFGFGVQYVNYGSEYRTDETGTIDGKWYANDLAYYMGYGMKWKNYRFGANIKAITSFYEVYYAIALAVDVSAMYIKDDFSATLAIRNAGYMLKGYNNIREGLPLNIELGVAQQLEHLPLTVFVTAHDLQQLNIRYPRSEEEQDTWESNDSSSTEKKYVFDKVMRHMTFGGELKLGKNLRFRLAYNYHRRQDMKLVNKAGSVGMSWGFGLNIKKMQLSFSRANYSFAGSPNNLSLNFKLKGGKKKEINPKI